MDKLRQEAAIAAGGFASQPASKILPFIEQMGTWTGKRKEFSWEREWRHLGDFTFSWDEVALVLCPEAEIDEFEALGSYNAVDPSWSLERMIATIVRKRALMAELEATAARRRARAGRVPGS